MPLGGGANRGKANLEWRNVIGVVVSEKKIIRWKIINGRVKINSVHGLIHNLFPLCL